jgi:hypothetical protein
MTTTFKTALLCALPLLILDAALVLRDVNRGANRILKAREYLAFPYNLGKR